MQRVRTGVRNVGLKTPDPFRPFFFGIQAAIQTGGDGNDTLQPLSSGHPGYDTYYYGHGGDDLMIGGAGDDRFYGGLTGLGARRMIRTQQSRREAR